MTLCNYRVDRIELLIIMSIELPYLFSAYLVATKIHTVRRVNFHTKMLLTPSTYKNGNTKNKDQEKH